MPNPNGYEAPTWNGNRWVGGWETGHPSNSWHDPNYVDPWKNAPSVAELVANGGGNNAGTTTGWRPGDPVNYPQTGGRANYDQQGVPPAQASGGTGQAGVGQISSSITPRPVYSDAMTTKARNMAVNDAMRRASPISAYKKFDRPGASRSLATQQLAMPTIAGAYVDAAKAKAGIPLADLIANEQNLFQGQMARANEFMGLGQLQLGEQSLNNYSVQQLIQMLAPILGSVF